MNDATKVPEHGILAVRPECPMCGYLHVPAYRTVVMHPGRWLIYRRCGKCRTEFKGLELSMAMAKSEGFVK